MMMMMKMTPHPHSPGCWAAHRSSSPPPILSPPSPGILATAAGPLGPGTSDWPRDTSVIITSHQHIRVGLSSARFWLDDDLNVLNQSERNWCKHEWVSRWWRCRDIYVSEPNWSSAPRHRPAPRSPAAPVNQVTHLSIHQVTLLDKKLVVMLQSSHAPSPVWGRSFSAGCQRLVGSWAVISSWWSRASSCWWTEHPRPTTPSASPVPPSPSQSTASPKSEVKGQQVLATTTPVGQRMVCCCTETQRLKHFSSHLKGLTDIQRTAVGSLQTERTGSTNLLQLNYFN